MDCFGDSDSDDAEGPSRPSANGVGVFHEGTEEALILYVERTVGSVRETDDLFASEASSGGDCDAVLEAVDAYCSERHWMMHVGDEKGAVLDAAVAAAGEVEHLVELGTYCGYSAVRIARSMAPGAHLWSVERDGRVAAKAARLLALAGVADRVTVVVAPTVSEALERLPGRVDFLFIDHEKALYAPDLKVLEPRLAPGATVVADNVLSFNAPLDAYLAHVRGAGYASSTLHRCRVEYSRAPGDAGDGAARDSANEDGVEVSMWGGGAGR